MEQLFEKIDQERLSRFKKPWAKLDKGSRINRLSAFSKLEKQTHSLSDEEETKLKIILLQLCETGGLTKATDVTYDPDTEQIITIKQLKYDEETRVYTYQADLKKVKTSQKSKSNVVRHFSRSKENKR
mgnify:CR=1 FL=1